MEAKTHSHGEEDEDEHTEVTEDQAAEAARNIE
jgi:hypothetical protein